MKAYRLPLVFDPKPLVAELGRMAANDWRSHYNVQVYTGTWRILPLRSVGGSMDRVEAHPASAEAFADTPVLARCPALAAVVRSFECPTTAVRLLSLGAGARIGEHRDRGLRLEEGEARLHIPVLTSPQVSFVLGGERVEMAAGECWYLDVNLPHSVVNAGTIDRVHLVVDCLLNGWLRALLPPVGDAESSAMLTGVTADNYRQVIDALRMQDTATATKLADDLARRWSSD